MLSSYCQIKKIINSNSKILISRQLRQRNVRILQKNLENKYLDQATHFSKSSYDQVEDNTAYQEVGEITKESQHDKLSRQSSYSTGVYISKSTLSFCRLKLDFNKGV